ncbi:LysR family transcriptional regulator [Thalassospira mesophila]|uniref:LysR family transcriptional regulator n=1 Tax=Thalassospira mesophila TaxID=1293891 RepID=A0A1Y2L1M3_9PROT|nr:LysR family transcriptional regulator [Thalassospira mesophila]OSQ39378.1 LysR family transcriptional regulator [Thalassospira mesophila]
MNYIPSLNDLKAFACIAAWQSFRKAADELGVAPSTLSHVIRTLEENMGVRLFHRTTRSVALTQAGEKLLSRLQPVLRDLDFALEEVNSFRTRPSGMLRLNTNEIAASMLLDDVVPAFLAQYPDMSLDLVTDGRLVDIVAEGFDAGIRLGEAIPQDMIAVRFGADARFVAVAAPDYFNGRTVPQSPEDLKQHLCIRCRLPSGKPYHWEFERHGQEINIDVPGSLTLDHPGMMAKAAIAGLGIAYVPQHCVTDALTDGRLRTVLDDWCPPIAGLFLYYPGHRHVPSGLRAFIDVMKATARF